MSLHHAHQIQWGTFPEFVGAVATIGAVIAASFAAWFAKRAAASTAAEASSAQTEVKTTQETLALTREQLDLARTEAERLQREATAANRNLETSRLDALAPVVLARCTPGWWKEYPRRFGQIGDPGAYLIPVFQVWDGALTAEGHERHEVPDGVRREMVDPLDYGPAYLFNFTVEFENFSANPARIALVDGDLDGLNWARGMEIILPPGGKKVLRWKRRTGARAEHEKLSGDDPSNGYLALHFWVRDLGMNVRDTFRLLADIRYFSVDGSMLVVQPELQTPWPEAWGEPTGARLYERLDQAGT